MRLAFSVAVDVWSLIAQSHHWIYPRGPAGGEIARQKGDCQNQDDPKCECDGIERLNPEQQRGQVPCHNRSANNAKQDAGQCEPDPLAYDKPFDPSWRRPQRYANADLLQP